MIEKASRSAADIVFFDLEDSVAPDDKPRARKNIIDALNDLDWGTRTVSVRINGLDTPFTYRDVIEVVEACPRVDMLFLPKVGVAADVYAVAPHTGRGGWTWYTGAAGWMYRLLIETLLGANLEGTQLRLTPHLPQAWPGFKIHYRYRQSLYHINISRLAADAADTSQLTLDGQALCGNILPLQDDHLEHAVELRIRC